MPPLLPRRKPRRTKAPTPKPQAGGPPPARDDGSQALVPHERDQSPGYTDSKPPEVIRQAKDDLDQGLVDSDLRATPGLDADRRKDLLKSDVKRKR